MDMKHSAAVWDKAAVLVRPRLSLALQGVRGEQSESHLWADREPPMDSVVYGILPAGPPKRVRRATSDTPTRRIPVECSPVGMAPALLVEFSI